MKCEIEIKELTVRDKHLLDTVGDDVFDDALIPRRSQEFLDDPRHHLVAALCDGRVIGFATAVHYVHPDKPAPELWVNEIGVSTDSRRQGLATAMMNELLKIGRDLGCSDVWVLTERSNNAAMRLYESIPNSKSDDTVMFTIPVPGE